jgi:hypothetical protein
MKTGRSRTFDGQKYTVLGTEYSVTRDGFECELLALGTNCADCGVAFRCLCSKRKFRYGQVNRRCEAHRRPGIKVRRVAKPQQPKPAKPVMSARPPVAHRRATRQATPPVAPPAASIAPAPTITPVATPIPVTPTPAPSPAPMTTRPPAKREAFEAKVDLYKQVLEHEAFCAEVDEYKQALGSLD